MRSHHNGLRVSGIVMVEVVVGIALMGLIAALAAGAFVDYRHARDACWWREAAMWAAAGQLQRIAAGAPLDSSPPAVALPEGISLQATREPGQGQWENFSRVTVAASKTVWGGRVIHEQISGFVRTEAKP
jgi:hypothetical protein